MSYCISVLYFSMANSDLLTKLCTQQNCCMHILDSQTSMSLLYEKYNILSIDNVIDLELCKLGYKLTNNCLPVSLLALLKGDATGRTLTKLMAIIPDTKGN